MIQLNLDTQLLRQAFRRAPGKLRQEMRLALLRSVQEMARTARRNAPKAHSILTNSIGSSVAADGLSAEVRATAQYARYVEDGTGPGGRPPIRTMIDWIKIHRITPNQPGMSERDLAFVLSRSIAIRGTPAQPFMLPAFNRHRVATVTRINDAIERALASA